MAMDASQVEALERATVHAVSPDAQAEIPGWILPFDPGTVGRARSAVPLSHAAPAASVLAVSAGGPVEVLTAPSQDWASVFLGAGFDPVDGASRVQKLGKAAGSLFAIVRDGARPAAAGAAAFSHGWASVHGMRTAQDSRGRGLAGRVLATLAGQAMARGYDRLFLQVAAENATAKSLYRRAGFATAWTYSYWRKEIAP